MHSFFETRYLQLLNVKLFNKCMFLLACCVYSGAINCKKLLQVMQQIFQIYGASGLPSLPYLLTHLLTYFSNRGEPACRS